MQRSLRIYGQPKALFVQIEILFLILIFIGNVGCGRSLGFGGLAEAVADQLFDLLEGIRIFHQVAARVVAALTDAHAVVGIIRAGFLDQILLHGQIQQLTGIGGNDRVYGTETRGDTEFVVTSGISDWAIQFKTGCWSEFVVIDVTGTAAK